MLVAWADHSLGASPNVEIVEQRISDRAILKRTSLLDEAAFLRAHESGPGLEGRRRAYESLRVKVVEHVMRLDAEISAAGWSRLTVCRVDIGAGDLQPACSMRDQEIRCGDSVRLTYREPALDIDDRGKRRRVHEPRWIVSADTVPGNKQSLYPVRGCIGGAWYEPRRGIVILHHDYACHGAAGDWCTVPSRWHVIYLGPALERERPSAKNGCEAGMVSVPGGAFTMGSPAGDPTEQPAHRVNVDAFCLDPTEVTVAEYRACFDAGRCPSPEPARWVGPGSWLGEPAREGCNWGVLGRERHPMNCVPWSFAEEFCRSLGKRLPTEAEWEYAARGPEGRAHPWGDGPPSQGVCWRTALGSTCPSGASPADRTPLGVLDLAGNVSEWTSTPYNSYDGCWPERAVVTRGGSAATKDATDLRGARRYSTPPAQHTSELGFRCAASR